MEFYRFLLGQYYSALGQAGVFLLHATDRNGVQVCEHSISMYLAK